MRKLALAVLFIGFTISANAQTATSSDKFVWGQTQDSLVPSAAVAQSLIYKLYEGTNVRTLTGVTCTGAAPVFDCQAPVLPFTPGVHTVTLTAALSTDPTSESLKSNVLSFTFKIVVTAPGNFRIAP